MFAEVAKFFRKTRARLWLSEKSTVRGLTCPRHNRIYDKGVPVDQIRFDPFRSVGAFKEKERICLRAGAGVYALSFFPKRMPEKTRRGPVVHPNPDAMKCVMK